MSFQQQDLVGALDCGTTSVRFIAFNSAADIVAEHQEEFPQYYEHPGWHSHSPDEIQEIADQCIAQVAKKLEAKGYENGSIKAIGITNQRETTVAWSRKTGKQLCKAIVWTDSRNKGEVEWYEEKLRDEGFEFEGANVKGDDAIEALKTL